MHTFIQGAYIYHMFKKLDKEFYFHKHIYSNFYINALDLKIYFYRTIKCIVLQNVVDIT